MPVSRTPRAVHRVRGAVAQALADLPEGALVLVACSGGADSLALAAATADAARRSAGRALRDGGAVLHLRAGAVIVDHALQSGSARVAGRAAATCRELGLDPVLVRRAHAEAVHVGANGPRPGADGPEGNARAARYAALDRAAQELGAAAVLLGHTLDDQAETVLLALGRGSGATALSGMAPVRGRYLRPLLTVRRSETHETCAHLGLAVHEDPTNAADGPWRAADGSPLRRAAVREHALPALDRALGIDVAPALARTATRLAQDAALLDSLAAEVLTGARCARCETTSAPVVLDVATVCEAPPALASRVLHSALLTAGAQAGQVTHRHLEALDLLLRRRGRGPAHLPGVQASRTESSRNLSEGSSHRHDCGTLVLASGARDADAERD